MEVDCPPPSARVNASFVPYMTAVRCVGRRGKRGEK